jgi:hypothetical protein
MWCDTAGSPHRAEHVVHGVDNQAEVAIKSLGSDWTTTLQLLDTLITFAHLDFMQHVDFARKAELRVVQPVRAKSRPTIRQQQDKDREER